MAVLLGRERYNRLLEHIEDLQLAVDAAEARAEKEPIIVFEDYLAQWGEHVPDPSDK